MQLLERGVELDALASLLAQAATGEGRLVLLGGEAGIGKTVLVRHLSDRARDHARVLAGACDALSTPRPLAPLLDIAVESGGDLARLLAEDAPRHRLFAATLDALAMVRPTLLVIEDAHWADEATHDLLRFLGRRIGATGSLLIVTYRDDEVGPAHPLRIVIGDLATAAAVRRMSLAPLTLAAVQTLAADSGLDPVVLYQQTGGNPFYVTEVLAEDAPRHRLFAATLDALAMVRPTLLVIEDAHWADEATLDLLRFLGRRVGATGSLLIVTYRDDEVGPAHPLRIVIGDLATAAAVHRMSLAPLSLAAVQTLAADSGLDPVVLYQQTGGNPFYVTEVLAEGGQGIPPTVRDAVLARAARLSAAAREMLDAAAVIGAKAEPWLLTEVVPLGVKGVDECLAAGLLQPREEALAFRHELARGAVLEAMSAVRAVTLHRSVLAALRRRPSHADDLARLAHHAEAAADEEAVLTLAPAAARRAAELGAHREAVAQYARALRFAGRLPADQREPLLASLFLESHLTGQLDGAIAAGQALVTLARDAGDRAKEAERLAWLAWVMVIAGRNAEAEQASRAALDLLAPLPIGPAHGFAFFVQATLRMLDRDNAEAIDWGERAIAIAERFGTVEVRVRALNSVGAARILAGDETRGRADMEQSLALARAAGLDGDVAAVYSVLGSALGEIYRFPLAEEVLTEGIAYTAERDLDRWRWYIAAWLALTRFYQGRWSEATELAASVLRTPSATTISRIMALLGLGRVRARRGDPEVTATLDEALHLAAPTGTLQRLAPVRAARAEAAWLAGDRERTAAEARAAFDLAQRHEHRWHLGELGFWLWRVGELTEPPAGAAEPFALQIGGDWAGAAAAWRDLGCPYEAARALADSHDEASLREALAVFERLGARPATLAVKRRLHDIGARDIPRGPRPATRANPAHLTPREAEILALIAAGSTNAEIAARIFLSPKTVEHHVSSILAKLDARSRVEAIRAARELGILSPN